MTRNARNARSASNVDRSSELANDFEPRTYRGSDLDELLPRIRQELGPDAIVVRQREGLDGGVGGFFQKRCVEVVARRATTGVDMYDSQPTAVAPERAPAPAPAPEPRAPAIQEIMRVASPFIEQLQAAEASVEPLEAPMYVPESFTRAAAESQPEPAVVVVDQPLTGAYGASAYVATPGGAMVLTREPEQAAAEPTAAAEPGNDGEGDDEADVSPAPSPRTRAAANHERTLVAAGIAPRLAADIIDATISHVVPFGPARALKRLVREGLARRISLAPPVAPGGCSVAFVGAGGSGKTLCVARLATAYAKHSDLAVSVLSLAPPERGGALREQLDAVGVDVLDAHSTGARRGAAGGCLTVLDTPAVSPADAAKVKALAAELERLGAPEVHVTVPATLSAAAVRALLDGLAALEPVAIVLTHLDEVAHAGPVIDEAIARGIAISYTSDGSAEDGFAPADPLALATRVLA